MQCFRIYCYHLKAAMGRKSCLSSPQFLSCKAVAWLSVCCCWLVCWFGFYFFVSRFWTCFPFFSVGIRPHGRQAHRHKCRCKTTTVLWMSYSSSSALPEDITLLFFFVFTFISSDDSSCTLSVLTLTLQALFCQRLYSQENTIASKDRDTVFRAEMAQALAQDLKPKYSPFKAMLTQLFSRL